MGPGILTRYSKQVLGGFLGFFVLVVAVVVTAFLNMTVFKTLYACLMGMVLLYAVTVLVCRRLM